MSTEFIIQSTNSGLVLDVPGGFAQVGNFIQLYPQHGGTNQRWTIRRKPNTFGYEIVTSLSSGNGTIVLDVPGFSTSQIQIQQFPENGGLNQQWTITPVASTDGNSQYEIVSVNSGLVLDVLGGSISSGTHIQQFPVHGGANQQWEFQASPPGSPLLLADGSAPQRQSGGPVLTLDGVNFPPGIPLNVVYMGLPAKPKTLVFAGNSGFPPITVAPDGTFAAEGSILPTSFNPSDTFLWVTVGVEDNHGNLLAFAKTSAETWVYP
jgi:hypothetical protein